MKFIKALGNYMKGNHENGIENVQGVKGLERLESLEGLGRLERLESLETSRKDYRLIEIPDGSTVYADPPYQKRKNSKNYAGEFNYQSFEKWLEMVPFPVIVSEYEAPSGCVEIASIEKLSVMAAKGPVRTKEKLFVQGRFAGWYWGTMKEGSHEERI